jgi:hypothetical protein
MLRNKSFKYSFEKNELLKQDRNIGFEDIILSNEHEIFLKTIVPSRKLNQKYNTRS